MRRLVFPLSLAILLSTAAGVAAGENHSCVFVVSMVTGVDVNNLDFTVNYSALDGNIEGTENRPECSNALEDSAFAGFHDNDATKKLDANIIRLSYFSSPAELVGCRVFFDTLEPILSDFSVTVTNAGRDGGDDNVDPLPTLQVTSVECPGVLPSPTTTTTTTTTTSTTTTTTLVTSGRCGFPVSKGEAPTASDALFALKVSVGVGGCSLCVCDINGNASVTAGDALGLLRVAVGGDTPLNCPAC